jgi:hypothetical protein
MKFTALMLIACIVFLSSFAGNVKPALMAKKTNCCAKTKKNAHCPKETEKKHQEDNCEKYGCNMLLTCSICGFLMVEPVEVKPVLSKLSKSSATIYKLGNSANYIASDWKPPKAYRGF